MDTQRTDVRFLTAPRSRAFGTPFPRWVRIFIASVMLVIAAAGGVTHDLLAVWNTQSSLEIDAARVAAAGVKFLPGAPARAMLAAAHSAALCGLRPSEVVHADAGSDGLSFNVTVQRTAPVLFFRLLGLSGVDITAQASARVVPSTRQRNFGGPAVRSIWPIVRNEV